MSSAAALWMHELALDIHVYWERKEQFQFSQDTYPNWVVFAVEDGQFAYRIGNQSGTAEQGDLVFCPPYVPFHRETITPLTFHFLHFTPKPELPEGGWEGGKISLTDTRRLSSTYYYFRKLYQQTDPQSLRRLNVLFNDLWQQVCGEANTGIKPIPTLSPELYSEDEVMNRAADWLRHKALTPFSMRELSQLLRLSPVQMTRKFRTAFQLNPSDYVKQLRMTRACWLLRNSELTIEKIAEQCGYQNGFYFSRAFKEALKVPPSAYRSQHRV